ncbi:MAG: type II toxin-antitoxin system RelE/ParE family toxin [Anaerolineae bacterium]
MRFKFASKRLQEMYTEEKYVHKYPAGVVNGFFRVMSVIEAAASEQDLYALKSLHFEQLTGDRKGQSSLRLNKQYRLIVVVTEDDEGRYIEIVEIVDYH